MSHSTTRQRLPLEAIASARLTATVVFPSLGTEEVTTIEQTGSSTFEKRMFARSVFAAFWTTD